jgi:hypothetical protein
VLLLSLWRRRRWQGICGDAIEKWLPRLLDETFRRTCCSCGSQIKLGVIAFIFPDAMGAIGQERRLRDQHQRRDDCGNSSNRNRALLRMMLLNRDTSTCRRSGLFVGDDDDDDDDDNNMVVGSILLSRCFGCSVILFGMLDGIIRRADRYNGNSATLLRYSGIIMGVGYDSTASTSCTARAALWMLPSYHGRSRSHRLLHILCGM